MAEIKERTLYVFQKRGGKVTTAVEGLSQAMLTMWALNHISQGKIGILVTNDDFDIERVFIGRKDDMPTMTKTVPDEEGWFPNLHDFIKDETHIYPEVILNRFSKSA